MGFFDKIYLYAFILSAFFLKEGLHAQGNILELLPGTEKVIFDQKTGQHRLLGTVNFTYQGNTMYCDSAHYHHNKKIVHAYGNVQIKKDDINLFCDSLLYYGATKYAKLWGNVRIRDLEYKIATDSLDYNAKNGRATYRNYGKIESIVSNEMVTSKYGYFYPNIGSFFFSGKVLYKKEDLIMTTDTLQFAYEKQLTQFFGPTEIKNDSVTINCERGSFHVQKEEGTLYKNVKISQSGQVVVCDTAYYASKPQIFTARGKVQIDDNQNNQRLLSDVFYSNQSIGKSYITGNALAIQKTENDSIYLLSDTLTILEDSIGNTKAMIGNKNVKIYSNGMQSISDSAYYDNKTGQLTLSKSPIVWAKNAQLKGDTIVVFMMDSLVKKAIVSGKASAIMELDSGLYYNQLSGRKMTAWFDNNELQRADMNGNAWTILYPIEELKTDSSITKKRLGLNRLYASDLRVFLDSGEVKSITYFDKPDGVFYPMNQIKEEEKFIVGFNWLVSKRPKRPKNIGRKI